MDIQELRKKQAELKALQEVVKAERDKITAANAKYFTAIVTGQGAKQSIAALFEQSTSLNQPDITLSGKVDGIDGTVSVRVRFGKVLNANR